MLRKNGGGSPRASHKGSYGNVTPIADRFFCFSVSASEVPVVLHWPFAVAADSVQSILRLPRLVGTGDAHFATRDDRTHSRVRS